MAMLGTLGNKWPDCWKDAGDSACTCKDCHTLHEPTVGISGLIVLGECPSHRMPDNRINLFGAGLGSNFLERPMRCGCLPVGVMSTWAMMHQPGVLVFQMEVECNRCGASDSTLCLGSTTWAGAQVEYRAKRIEAQPCCDDPCLNFVHFSADMHKFNSCLSLKLDHILFSDFSVPDRFPGGESVDELAKKILHGRVNLADLAKLEVFVFGNTFYTKNNEMLLCLKKVAAEMCKSGSRFRTIFSGGLYEPEVMVKLVHHSSVWSKPVRQPHVPAINVYDDPSLQMQRRRGYIQFEVDRVTASHFSVQSAWPGRPEEKASRLPLGSIFYCQDSIKRYFHDDRPLDLMERELKSGVKTVLQIPVISVIKYNRLPQAPCIQACFQG